MGAWIIWLLENFWLKAKGHRRTNFISIFQSWALATSGGISFMEQAYVISENRSEETVPTLDQKKERGQWRVILLKCVFSGFLMYWILQGTNLSEIFHSVQTAHLPLLIGAFALVVPGYFISVNRWRILLKAQGISASVLYLIKSFMVSAFFNNLLPSTIGGDMSRVYDTWRLGASKGCALAVIFVDRFLGLLALMLVAVLGLFASNPFGETISFLSLWIFGGLFALLLFVWAVFHPSLFMRSFTGKVQSYLSVKLSNSLTKITNGFQAFHGRTDTLIQALGLSLILQANVVFQYYLIAKALHFQVPLQNFLLIIPLALFIMLIPISINGLGIRESVFVLFFSPWGVAKPDVLAFAWIAYGFLLVWGLVGGVVCAFRNEAPLRFQA